MMTRNGSAAAFVMRTGTIQPVSPEDARQDLVWPHLDALTNMNRQTALYADPVHADVAQTVTAQPPSPIQTPPSNLPLNPSARHAWRLQNHRVHPAIADIKRLHPHASMQGAADVELGEWQGRPVAKFNIQTTTDPESAQAQANALRRAAGVLRSSGLSQLPPELVAGPLAALMRGGAVELHFQNGVVIRTAL